MELYYRPDQGGPWIAVVEGLEIHVAGHPQAADAEAATLASAALADRSWEPAVLAFLEAHRAPGHNWEVQWLEFRDGGRSWQACYALTSEDVRLDDVYGKWMVTLRGVEPVRVERENY